jgi:hypothetical protein
MSNRLIHALESRQLPSERFTCPRTGLELTAHAPSRRIKAEALEAAARRWGDRRVETVKDLAEREKYDSEELIARCIHVDGGPIGLAVIRHEGMDEQTLVAYEEALERVSAQDADPAAESWTSDEVDGFVDLLKKNDRAYVEVLRLSGGARLRDLATTLAIRLATCETSTSST